MMRALGIDSTNLLNLTFELNTMGQLPYANPNPGRLSRRGRGVEGAAAPVELQRPDTKANIDGNLATLAQLQALVAAAPAGYTTDAEKISFALYGERVRQEELNAVQAYIDSQPDQGIILREAFELIASSESAQYF